MAYYLDAKDKLVKALGAWPCESIDLQRRQDLCSDGVAKCSCSHGGAILLRLVREHKQEVVLANLFASKPGRDMDTLTRAQNLIQDPL